ncbi:MAG: hypothetical protein KDC67_03650, partial [Ignavibacteriae bacterium]|nr:hypothetical protein [Ignavibacteriota bacterium]
NGIICFFFFFIIFSCRERTNTVHNYDIEFCDDCRTLNDIRNFEKRRGATELDLTSEQASRIFRRISCPLFSLYDEDGELMKSRFYFIRNNKNHFVKEVSAYAFNGDQYYFNARKYFYNDPIIDTIFPLKNYKSFDKNEFKVIFNHLREEYRAYFKDVKELHYDLDKFCKRKPLFEIETTNLLKKNLEDTHFTWIDDSLTVHLIYDYSYMFNKLDKKSNTIEVNEEDRAIYFLQKQNTIHQ